MHAVNVFVTLTFFLSLLIGPSCGNATPPLGGTPVLLPYLAYTGMCHWTGYGFLPLCSKQGIYFCAMARLIVCTASV